MKKAVLLAFLTLASVASAQKYAVVEMEDLVRLHPNTSADKKLLESMVKDFEAERDKLRSRVKELGESFEKAAKEYDNPALSEKAKQKAREDATRRREVTIEADRDLQETVRRRQQELSDQEMRMLKRTTDALREEVTAYAKEKGYQAIFAANVMPFYAKELDATDDVLKRLGVDPKLRKTLEKTEQPKKK